MAQCVLERGREIGVQAEQTLQAVEQAGMKQQAASEWPRAVREAAPLQAKLVTKFLPDGIAASFEHMGVDELRVCQVWMYALASRLGACRQTAQDFASAVGMRNPDAPLLNYDEARWDPGSAPWVKLEACVHAQAASAGDSIEAVWRRSRQRHTGSTSTQQPA